jgi:hypothetical protein
MPRSLTFGKNRCQDNFWRFMPIFKNQASNAYGALETWRSLTRRSPVLSMRATYEISSKVDIWPFYPFKLAFDSIE